MCDASYAVLVEKHGAATWTEPTLFCPGCGGYCPACGFYD